MYFVRKLCGAACGLVFVATMVATAAVASPSDTPVNAVIGDESYLAAHGYLPTAGTAEATRVRTHLAYVERLLRARPTGNLSEADRRTRSRNLDLLREYWQAGAFPHNDGHPDDRRPTFISVDGNICAVGYLVEQSLGRAVAEAVNESFKYAFIGEIDSSLFEAWVASSGLTLEELAMIQPTYGPHPGGESHTIETNRNRVELPYAAATFALTLANTVTLANGSTEPWVGLAAGSGTILLGLLNVDNRTVNGPICFWDCYTTIESNHLRSVVSYANIGIGTANVLISGYRLLVRQSPAEQQPAAQLGMTHLASPARPGDSVPAVHFALRF